MKTLINIDTSLITDYSLWENANKNNWNIASYLNQFYDVNTALAFSKFFFPDFLEKEGCIILSFRYDENSFKEWYKEFDGNIPSIERYCNIYDVADYFHINASINETDDLYQKVIDELASVIKKSWEINCKILFPDRKMIVEILREYDVTRITLYSGSN